jgi:hypothetical protein
MSEVEVKDLGLTVEIWGFQLGKEMGVVMLMLISHE